MLGSGSIESFNPSPCPSPNKLALASLPVECLHPQADADGRGDVVATVVQSSPLPEGEGQGERRFAQFKGTISHRCSRSLFLRSA